MEHVSQGGTGNWLGTALATDCHRTFSSDHTFPLAILRMFETEKSTVTKENLLEVLLEYCNPFYLLLLQMFQYQYSKVAQLTNW